MLLAGLGPDARRRARVLIVEDHADSRLMYVEYLGIDYEVAEAADGIEALEAVHQHVPDVIVTDLALPRMDGYELIERLRADERLKDIPVIALSGYSGREHDERMRRLAPAAVLQKPCLPDSLVAALEDQLRRRDEGAS